MGCFWKQDAGLTPLGQVRPGSHTLPEAITLIVRLGEAQHTRSQHRRPCEVGTSATHHTDEKLRPGVAVWFAPGVPALSGRGTCRASGPATGPQLPVGWRGKASQAPLDAVTWQHAGKLNTALHEPAASLLGTCPAQMCQRFPQKTAVLLVIAPVQTLPGCPSQEDG